MANNWRVKYKWWMGRRKVKRLRGEAEAMAEEFYYRAICEAAFKAQGPVHGQVQKDGSIVIRKMRV